MDEQGISQKNKRPLSIIVEAIILVATLLILHLLPLQTVRAESIDTQSLIPVLSSDSEISTTGFYRLSWQTEAQRVELQEAQEPTFENPQILYIGPDRATSISGKPDGKWFYRVRTIQDDAKTAWSQTLAVTVKHHSLGKGLLFFGIGLFIFIAIVLMITVSARKLS